MTYISLNAEKWLNPCRTRVASFQRSTLLKKLQIAEVRAVQTPRTPCGGGFLSMLKTNAAAWRLHSVLDSTLWGLLERRSCVVGAPRERCKDAV